MSFYPDIKKFVFDSDLRSTTSATPEHDDKETCVTCKYYAGLVCHKDFEMAFPNISACGCKYYKPKED